MDQNSHVVELKRKRELANTSLEKRGKRKRQEAQQQNEPNKQPNSQSYRPSTTYQSYTTHIRAHQEFHKRFTQNSFGLACNICDRLWFKNDLKNLNDEDMEFVKTFLPNDEHPSAVCSTCRTSIKKKCIPRMAVYNGFKYPKIPNSLLNCPLGLVSERLISPRYPFMEIRRLSTDVGQYGIYGQVINVPVDKNVHKLSLLYGLVDKSSLIAIKKWVRYLVNTPLHRKYGITMSEEFLYGLDTLSEYYIENDSDKHEYYNNESAEDIPQQSLISHHQENLLCDVLHLNSGKDKKAISLLDDEYAEELSFPSIYLGQFREFRKDIKVSPFRMATSELRRSDRRGVTPHHLLYMAIKIMTMRVNDSLRVAFKHVGKNADITKEEILSGNYFNSCIESNLAFLRSVPNSTWYWSKREKDLNAMIRQLGKPTVFFTISANEIEWSDLLQILYKLNKQEDITEEAVAKLHFKMKSTLINEDAVTCAIYFNKLVNVILNILQSKECSPFGKFRVLHYCKRIEFQHGGSPHARILAWLDNAPKDALNEDYDTAIQLIDALISVSASEASGNIKLQTYESTGTCYKKSTSNEAQKSRFEAPFMPSKKTMILNPMKDTEKGFNQYRKRFSQIRIRLEKEDYVNMDEFYNRNSINSDEDYCNIIRAGINRPNVFLKREPFEKWHKPFNPFIFNIAKSSTDFHFIAEEHSCAAYVVEYFIKTNRRGNLQKKIIQTINDHLNMNIELDVTEITRNIGINILNNIEISCQEAAWYLLRQPFSKTSTIIVYIPTVRPHERQRIRKNGEELSELEDDSNDIWQENWFDKYEKRPKPLEDITLAQFVSEYGPKFVKREKKRIIRYRDYDMTTDLSEYKREMVTLHFPFRSEENEILADDKYISIYDYNEELILERKKNFESNVDIHKIIVENYAEN